jgi:hypothetical protein
MPLPRPTCRALGLASHPAARLAAPVIGSAHRSTSRAASRRLQILGACWLRNPPGPWPAVQPVLLGRGTVPEDSKAFGMRLRFPSLHDRRTDLAGLMTATWCPTNRQADQTRWTASPVPQLFAVQSGYWSPSTSSARPPISTCGAGSSSRHRARFPAVVLPFCDACAAPEVYPRSTQFRTGSAWAARFSRPGFDYGVFEPGATRGIWGRCR